MMKKIACLVLLMGLGIGIARAANEEIYAPTTSQRATFGCTPTCSAAQISNAFGAQTEWVRVVLNGATGFISFGTSGTTPIVTAATGIYMPVEVPALFRVSRNGTMRILAHSASGTAYITELSK